MQQTAVQWLIDQLITENEVTLKGENYKLFEQAKAMEKEQLKECWEDGKQSFSSRTSERYYIETYGK